MFNCRKNDILNIGNFPSVLQLFPRECIGPIGLLGMFLAFLPRGKRFPYKMCQRLLGQEMFSVKAVPIKCSLVNSRGNCFP
jgi:hypothetical protein